MSGPFHVDDKDLRELMGAITHDLRNPLAAIITNLEFAKRVAEQESLDPDLVDSIEDSVTACDVLRRIVTNLDVLVKGQDLGCSLNEGPLRRLVDEVVQRIEARAQQASIRVELDPGDSNHNVMVDHTLFGLALENLLANSLQHSPSGSTIQLSIREDDRPGRVIVEVRDRGGAISEPELALSPGGNTHRGRKDGTRYGRGVSLLAARVAASATGSELSLHGEGEDNVMRLHLDTMAKLER